MNGGVEPMSDYRDQLFSDYYESSYKHGNILTPKQFEMASEAYANEYRNFMPQHKDAAILDFGCGTGSFLFYLKKEGYTNFFGVDISAQQITYCKTHITDRVEVINGMDYLHNKQGAYDFIVLHDVLEHMKKQDVMTLLNLLHQALKDGGTLLVRVPNMSTPFGLDARFNDFTHEVGFTSKSLYQILFVTRFTQITILPPSKIQVRSLNNFIRMILVKMLHQAMRFCFYIQDYTVPKNLDKNIVAVARK
jgi:cyclopropane fatty-acyl-phospholipid synthase-like methyltransferase